MKVLDRFLELPIVYAAWQAPFARQKFLPVERAIESKTIRRALDVGCGPGTNAARFQGVDYVGIDINERYISQARQRHSGRFIQADLATADLSGLGKFDLILVNSFLHHLPDPDVDRILTQVQGLLDSGGRVHVLELVLPDRWSMARVMARLDRGKYARSLETWITIFGRHFTPLVVAPFQFGRGLWSMIYFQGGHR